MSNKPTHDICIAEDYTSGGEEKTNFTNVGTTWLKDSGTMSCEIRKGISLSGRIVIIPKRDEQ